MFTLSVITMIGWVGELYCAIYHLFVLLRYGNLVPRTKWGKIVTMMYALCGIPVYILYFKNMGKVRGKPSVRIFKYFQVFANIFKWIYRQILSCGNRRKAFEKYDVMEEELEEMDHLPHEEEV